MKFQRKAPTRGSAGRKRRTAVVTASGIAFLGTAAATVLGAVSAHAGTITSLTGQQAAPVAHGAAAVQNNEWGSSEPESIATSGNAGFTVVNSAIANATNGAPGGYPSIYSGCHWGACTQGGLSDHPVPVQKMITTPGTARTSWSTTQPGGNSAYDVAYDIWFNQQPTTTSQPNGAEMMVWINHRGGVEPYGNQVGTADIDGVSYTVWEGAQSWGDTISYVRNDPTTSVTNMDIGPLAADAVHRGYIKPSWYLIDVEAGFELWRGGTGLATNSFSVSLSKQATSGPAETGQGTVQAPAASSTPAPSTPAPSTPAPSTPAPSTPAPSAPAPSTPAPSAPAPTSGISLQAVSPQPTSTGTATNATVAFTNTGSASASNVTLVVQVVNSAGKVVGSQSWAGANIAPQSTLSETYGWTAGPAGTYTVKALMQSSSGQTLQQANVGTVTVS